MVAESAPRLVLELDLEPAAATRLLRHPALTARRAGRSRSNAEELIWLDTAEGALADDGLALEQPKRGPPRLLRTLPPGDLAWVPGGTAPTVRDRSLPHATPVPIAAFSGRRTLLPLATADGAVQAVLLLGKLRAVANERPTARLTLDGPVEAVLDLAQAIAIDLPAVPPRAALAEEGRALARGEAPRPRRKGPAELGRAATVEDALCRAIGHLLEALLFHAPLCQADAGPEGVHQARVALRRLRSVLKAFRPAAGCPEVAAFDAGLKALADRLGPARDWDVFLSGLGPDCAAAMPQDKRLAALLRAAEAKRRAAYDALRTTLDGPGFRRLVLDGITLPLRRPWRTGPDAAERAALLDEPLAEFAQALLDKRWHKLCEEGEQIDTHGAEALHEVRLEAKRLRYAAELFAPIWPGKATRRFLKRLSALQEDLGVANDTIVARALVGSLGSAVPAWAVGVVEGYASAHVPAARKHALSAWEDLMVAEPFWKRV